MKKMIDRTENTDNNEAALEIDLLPLLLHLLKKLWIIILVAVISGTVTYTASKMFVKPTYRCGFTAYINNRLATSDKELLTSSDVTAAKELVKTYANILKSNTILSSADEVFDLDYSVEKLKKMISTEIQDGTEIIQIYVVAKTPEEAYKVATAIASTAPENMADIVEGSSMKIVEFPQMPKAKYQPSYTRYALIGFLLGALLSAAVLIIRYLLDDTVTDEAEIENRLNVPVLGVIPDVFARSGGKSKYYYYNNYYYEKKDKEKGRHNEKDRDNNKEEHKDEKA